MNRIDVGEEIGSILVRTAAADERSVLRIARIWNAMCDATFADDVYPVEHFLSVVLALQNTGNLRLELPAFTQVLTLQSQLC